MSTVNDIMTDLEKLSPKEVEKVRHWLNERAEAAWDRQIEQDAQSGKLDKLIDSALEEHRAGRTRPI